MTSNGKNQLLVPNAPVLVTSGVGFICLTLDGEFLTLSASEAKKLASETMPIICNATQVAAKMGVNELLAYDVLELFAFVMPGIFAVPNVRGLIKALNLFEPANAEDECLALRDLIKHLLLELRDRPPEKEKSNPAGIASMMGLSGNGNNNLGWPWTTSVLAALGRLETPPDKKEIHISLRVWENMHKEYEMAPIDPPNFHEINADEALSKLQEVLTRQRRSNREEQNEYASFLTGAFKAPTNKDKPNVLLAEAGTGVGKTLGYLSPSTAWAEKNDATVCISTYTRNLQRQIDTELGDFYESHDEKKAHVVTRKGRENYLCLLNLEDITHAPSIAYNFKNAIALGLMLRWAAVTEEGDFAGKDFPGWLAGLIGPRHVASFADRRGECVYTACQYFDKCFIEKSVRRAAKADIVISNHALVMNQIANSYEDGATMPAHYIFDEGHHLFEAADSAFDLQINGKDTEDLRRWLLGLDNARRNRARGLKRRIEDLIADDEDQMRNVEYIIEAARSLPGDGWRQRLLEGNPKGLTENFLVICRNQVLSRNKEEDIFYSIECGKEEPIEGLLNAAFALQLKLRDMLVPMRSIIKSLNEKLSDEASNLESEAKERIRYTINSLKLRADVVISGWVEMLESLKTETPSDLIDWFEITRIDGKETDVGLYRRYVDPIKVFGSIIKPKAQGIAITSATLRDISEEDGEGWGYALKRSGSSVLEDPHMFSVASPFNYADQTRVYVVNDIDKNNPDETASAYRELFLASGGGALGIFTAVQRLKKVHEKISEPLAEKNIQLYSQHIDPLDIASLLDIFKEEENACLLGTDATRDGIDVPGRSLRLVVYDRVPWPKPNLLHKARRQYFGAGYDDMLTRFKLKQGYGRLVRKSDDVGVFVLLDSRLPTRLTSAFPEGVEIRRMGLKQVIEEVKSFLN